MSSKEKLGDSKHVDVYTLEEPSAKSTEVENLSPGERAPAIPKPTNLRRWGGLVAGIVASVLTYYLLPTDLAHNAKVTAGLAILMGIWWMMEALPIPATALAPLVVYPVFSDVPFNDVGASYGNNIIFLFMGGFMLALAMQRWNLHRRIALVVLKVMGAKTDAMIGGFMIATGFISMWVSNTATVVMMLPIGMSVLLLVERVMPSNGDTKSVNERGESIVKSNFAIALMLGIAYSASLGSLGTIIGTPPNTLLVGYLQESFDIRIGFGQWMLVGVPIAVTFLFIAWVLLTKVMFKPEIKEVPSGKKLIRDELALLGPISTGERRVLAVFLLTAVSWVFIPIIFPEPPISDAGIALVAALLLFTVPAGKTRGVRLLDWQYAVKLPWGILLLFGGGLALSSQFTSSGLTEWIGNEVATFGGLPTWILVVVVTTIIIFLTEITSNTATAATFLPVAGGIAIGIGANPMLLAIPVALAATCAFMLPVATPPNAVVFSSGYVTIGQMVKGGFWLNLIGIVLINITTLTLAVWVFEIVI